jgi:hypothetical protein
MKTLVSEAERDDELAASFLTREVCQATRRARELLLHLDITNLWSLLFNLRGMSCSRYKS